MTMDHTHYNKNKNSNKSWWVPNSFYDDRDNIIVFYIIYHLSTWSSFLLLCLFSIWHQPFAPSAILSFCYISHPLAFLLLNHFYDISSHIFVSFIIYSVRFLFVCIILTSSLSADLCSLLTLFSSHFVNFRFAQNWY